MNLEANYEVTIVFNSCFEFNEYLIKMLFLLGFEYMDHDYFPVSQKLYKRMVYYEKKINEMKQRHII